MKKSDILYKRLVLAAPYIVKDNPIVFNELFALAFIFPYLANDKIIAKKVAVEIMEKALYLVNCSYLSPTYILQKDYHEVLQKCKLFKCKKYCDYLIIGDTGKNID